MIRTSDVIPKVGIILLNYCNYRDTLTCVDSLNHIDYQNYIIIIIDNNSTDDSFEKLKLIESERIIVFNSGKNGGFAFGNNVGIDIAIKEKCEYILLLNNDTTVDNSFLSKLVGSIQGKPNVGIVTGKILYGNEKNKIWYAGGYIDWKNIRATHRGINEIDSLQYENREKVTFASGCCMLIPVSIIYEVGKVPEDYFMYYEDLDYCELMAVHDKEIIYNPQAIIYHYVSSSSGGIRSPFVIEWTNRSRRHFSRKYRCNIFFFIKTEIRELLYIILKDRKINAFKAYIRSYKKLSK